MSPWSLWKILADDVHDSDGAKASVNTIKDMLAGLPEFQEGKERFGLHLDMAGKCVKVFQDHKLLDVGSVEQVRRAEFPRMQTRANRGLVTCDRSG